MLIAWGKSIENQLCPKVQKGNHFYTDVYTLE